jgi:hypothetical protein
VAEEAAVGPVVDIRGTDDAMARAVPLRELGLLDLAPAGVLHDELGADPYRT